MSSIFERLEPPGRTDDGHVIVRLTNEDWELANLHGARRVTANMHKKDAPSYQNGHNQLERIAQTDAVLCEVAVARHLNLDFDWDMASWKPEEHRKFRDRPDVGTNIEVRRVRSPNGKPSLRPKQVGKGLYLFVAYVMPAEGFNVKLIGWCDYDWGWERAGEASYEQKVKSGSRTLPQDFLSRCTCFFPGALHGDPLPLAG